MRTLWIPDWLMFAFNRVQKWEGLCSLFWVPGKHGSEDVRQPQQTNGRSAYRLYLLMYFSFKRRSYLIPKLIMILIIAKEKYLAWSCNLVIMKNCCFTFCHWRDFQNVDTTCESGCYCPHGHYEDHRGNCVPWENCTCVYSGKVFSVGQSVTTNCKTW